MLTKEELSKIRSAVNGRRELSFGTIRKLVDEVERLTALQPATTGNGEWERYVKEYVNASMPELVRGAWTGK